jgi:hypothetical protein
MGPMSLIYGIKRSLGVSWKSAYRQN